MSIFPGLLFGSLSCLHAHATTSACHQRRQRAKHCAAADALRQPPTGNLHARSGSDANEALSSSAAAEQQQQQLQAQQEQQQQQQQPPPPPPPLAASARQSSALTAAVRAPSNGLGLTEGPLSHFPLVRSNVQPLAQSSERDEAPDSIEAGGLSYSKAGLLAAGMACTHEWRLDALLRHIRSPGLTQPAITMQRGAAVAGGISGSAAMRCPQNPVSHTFLCPCVNMFRPSAQIKSFQCYIDNRALGRD